MNLDNQLRNTETSQQRDLEDGVVAEEDFQVEDIIDENPGNENDAEQASNKDQDEVLDLEICDERFGGTHREPLKLIVTLNYGGSEHVKRSYSTAILCYQFHSTV